MGATKPEQEKDGTPFYADNYTYSLHIGIEVDSLFRQDKVFVRNRVDCFVGYAVIFVAVFTIAGAVVGKGNHQCVGTLLKNFKQTGQLTVDISQCCRVRFLIVFRFTFHIVTVRVMDSGKVDIHEYTFVRRVILQFLQGKINLLLRTVRSRTAKDRQPVTFRKITGKHTSQFIAFAEEIHAAYADCLISLIGKALHESSFRKRITAFGRDTPRSLPAQGKTAIYGYARNEALPAKEESLQK